MVYIACSEVDLNMHRFKTVKTSIIDDLVLQREREELFLLWLEFGRLSCPEL